MSEVHHNRHADAAALSPAMLAGFALRPVPPALLRPALALAMALMRRRHAEVFARLAPLGARRVEIDPTDLPFRFLLLLDPEGPELDILAADDPGDAPSSARISGPLAALIELLQGRIDGDALFFSRALTIEGDTEIVLALRNAVDSAEIDLAADLLAPLGPLGGPVRRLATLGGALASRAVRDLDALRAVLIAPVARDCARQGDDIAELRETVITLKRELARRRRVARPPAPPGFVAGGRA